MGIQRTYNPPNGVEVATMIAKGITRLALSIKGLNSRLVTFPRVRVEMVLRIEAFDREPVEVTDMDEMVEQLITDQIARGEDPGIYSQGVQEYSAVIDESESSADKLRRDAGIAVTKPTLNELTRQITDAPADPLPAGDNLSNISQFGKPGGATLQDGTHYSGRGRVMEVETVGLTPGGDVGSNPIREKLKGDGNSTHFRVRRPGE